MRGETMKGDQWQAQAIAALSEFDSAQLSALRMAALNKLRPLPAPTVQQLLRGLCAELADPVCGWQFLRRGTTHDDWLVEPAWCAVGGQCMATAKCSLPLWPGPARAWGRARAWVQACDAKGAMSVIDYVNYRWKQGTFPQATVPPVQRSAHIWRKDSAWKSHSGGEILIHHL
jgi:hypothetical protein